MPFDFRDAQIDTCSANSAHNLGKLKLILFLYKFIQFSIKNKKKKKRDKKPRWSHDEAKLDKVEC